jgi:hypothetical protein
MRSLAAAIACICAALLVGGSAVAADPGPAARAPADFAISYTRGGGLAPSTSKLVVRPGLRAVAATSGTRAGERTVRFRIGRGRVVALERGLAGAEFDRLESPRGSNCADCFYYSISYHGNRVSFDQSQVPAGLEEVIGELESVVTAHAIPPNVRAERG